MDTENANYHAEEIDGLRKLVHTLLHCQGECELLAKDVLVEQLYQLSLSVQREIQYRQLHLHGDAVVIMDRLQVELVLLSEDCHNFLSGDRQTRVSTAAKIYLSLTIEAINSLLDHFKAYYDYCFNFKMVVPSRYRTRVSSSLVKLWDKTAQALKSAGMDEKLNELLNDYHLEMKTEKKATFGSLDFWTALSYELSKIAVVGADEIGTKLCRLFCYHNFNYPQLIQYYILLMQRDYDTVDNYREEYFKITVELRSLRQFMVKDDYGYDANVINLKESLCNILENELLCIRKLVGMNKKVFEGSGTKYFMQQFYFKISISMEQFLFIFRLLIERSIVIVKRKADLYEFIHTHIGTVKKDNLSIGNMQNTYAENNRITAVKVKAILQSLIRLIDEKYLAICCVGLL